ncbi:MAG: TonB-dependent receptor [Steroidobacteraceae bacterium]
MSYRQRTGIAQTLTLLCFALGCAPSLQAQEAAVAEASSEPIAVVIVSARKRDEPEISVPASITTFTSETLENFDIRSFTDYAAMTPNLSFAYGGGPTGFTSARTVAIRGITGQNLMGTAGATGFYIGDTPVPISIDPRVLDIHDIEVLKGPQGTLYGESALGGNVRMVINPPQATDDALDFAARAGATDGGESADAGVSTVANLVVVPDQFALRVVTFADHDAGYLARTYPDSGSAAVTEPFLDASRTRVGNQGADTSLGGSVTALWRPTEGLALQLRLLGERQTYHGFPAAFAPLPQFRPDYTSSRAFDVQPGAIDAWTLSALELTYRGPGWTLVSSNSFFKRSARDVEDSTYGTQQALTSVYEVAGVPAQPFIWTGKHDDRQVTSETRLTFDPVRRLSGTLGVFYSDARTRFSVPPTNADGLMQASATNTLVGPAPSDLLWTQSNPGRQQDVSIFGELYYQILQPLTLTLGARQYWLRQDADYTADGFLNLGATPSDPQHNSERGFDPKYVLSYQKDDRSEFYVSAAKGFRAGSAQAYAPFCTLPDLPIKDITDIKSDTLWSYEAGAKLRLPDPDVLVTMAAYHINWSNPQQQVALPCGAYFLVNGKAAQISGAESEIVGHLTPGLQIRLGVGYEHTALTEPGALADAGIEAGTRIAGVPTWTASVGAAYRRALSPETVGFIAADYSYTGDSIALLNGGEKTLATRPSYSLVNLRFGVNRRTTELSIDVRNLTNAKPNLGDLGYIGYAQHDPAGLVIPQVATLQPLTVILEIRQSF